LPASPKNSAAPAQQPRIAKSDPALSLVAEIGIGRCPQPPSGVAVFALERRMYRRFLTPIGCNATHTSPTQSAPQNHINSASLDGSTPLDPYFAISDCRSGETLQPGSLVYGHTSQNAKYGSLGGIRMPRQTNFVSFIQQIVRDEVQHAIHGLFGSTTGTKKRATNGRRRRGRKARGKWRPGGPGRPPKAVAEKMAPKKAATTKVVHRPRRRRRGPGRPPGSRKKAA
jgi:hypothetical protein